MTWMQRLKRVFAIDIDTCLRCGGHLKVLASIEDPELISYILSHLQQRRDDGIDEHHCTPAAARAPPQLPLLLPTVHALHRAPQPARPVRLRPSHAAVAFVAKPQ